MKGTIIQTQAWTNRKNPYTFKVISPLGEGEIELDEKAYAELLDSMALNKRVVRVTTYKVEKGR